MTHTVTTTYREIPILFQTEMVNAILKQWKTQTRRIMNPQPKDCQYIHQQADDMCEWRNEPMKLISDIRGNPDEWFCQYCGNGVTPNGHSLYKCRYGQPGDILWVRETFAGDNLCGYIYRADHPNADLKAGDLDDGEVQIRNWRPSIFMPREACRIYLSKTGTRVQRLQDISEYDATAEGYPHRDTDNKFSTADTPLVWFEKLWRKINGEKSWKENPFVWVNDFELMEYTTINGDTYHRTNALAGENMKPIFVIIDPIKPNVSFK